VEITIGITNIARELTIQSTEPAETLHATVAAALADAAGTLSLVDEHGRTTIIPSRVIAFVQIGPEGPRRVGFGAV
jgi:hypothetical protein